MHAYKRPALDRMPPPSIDDFRFHDAVDVVAYAELNQCMGWRTWPEVWHLDPEGNLACSFKGSSLDSLVEWGLDPSDLERSRWEGLAVHDCPNRWVIIDSRPVGFSDPPGEGDAWAFLELRRHLAGIGVDLLDAVVFDDDGHWWSMHELTSGTTAWGTGDAKP